MEQVHLDYLEAGANIIITASYQVNYIFPRIFPVYMIFLYEQF